MERIRARIIHSPFENPYYNLALEETLLDEVRDDEIILFLWQNRDSVILGRNQNPWRECRMGQLESFEGLIARRLSGGGTVFHDLGNLNYSFISQRKNYDLDRQLNVIVKSLKRIGIEAEINERNDLLVRNRKVSGNAFYIRGNRNVHHGTLLIHTDLGKLENVLEATTLEFESKGVKSVLSKVINLTEVRPDLTVNEMKNALEEAAIAIYKNFSIEKIIKEDALEYLSEKVYKYRSWEWVYGETPKFSIEISLMKRPFQIVINVDRGIIQKVTMDGMDDLLKSKSRIFLTEKPFNRQTLTEAIKDGQVLNTEVGEAIQQWMNQVWN